MNPDSPIASSFIQAKSFTRAAREQVNLVIIHSTEGPANAVGIARWFSGSSAPPASAHYVVDSSGVVGCVHEVDVAWHAPPINSTSIGIEHCGFAKWTADQWPADLLENSAHLVACIAKRWSIPLVLLDVDALLRGDRGIARHADVSKAWKKSSHWDPGGMDVDALVARAVEIAGQ